MPRSRLEPERLAITSMPAARAISASRCEVVVLPLVPVTTTVPAPARRTSCAVMSGAIVAATRPGSAVPPPRPRRREASAAAAPGEQRRARPQPVGHASERRHLTPGVVRDPRSAACAASALLHRWYGTGAGRTSESPAQFLRRACSRAQPQGGSPLSTFVLLSLDGSARGAAVRRSAGRSLPPPAA